jgi:hypothetical protein
MKGCKEKDRLGTALTKAVNGNCAFLVAFGFAWQFQ